MSFCPSQHNPESKGRDIPGHYIYTGLAVLAFSMALYIFTLAPAVIWGDSAEFALQVKKLKLSYAVDGHPLFIILGTLFSLLPFELAYSLNLLSAVSASITVFLVYLIIIEITDSKISALAGSLALCVSHAFWLHAVITEVYDLNACFSAAVILSLLKWRKDKSSYTPLYLAALLFGLGLSNHRIIIFDLAGIVFFVIATDPQIFKKLKVLSSALLSFLTGSLLLIYIVITKLSEKPVTEVADKFTAGGYKEAVLKFQPNIIKEIGLYLSYLFYQYPLIGFLLGFIGISALFKKDKKLVLFFILLIGVNALFFLKFGKTTGSTKYTFYISAYMVFSILIGYGFYFITGMIEKKGSSVKKYAIPLASAIFFLPVVLYNIAPYASKSLGIDLLHARTIPYRDNEEFFLNPSKLGYTGAERYALEAFDAAVKDSIIIADHTPLTVLRYFQEIKGIRTDITLIKPGSWIKLADGTVKINIIKDIVAENYGKREIYLAGAGDERYYRLNIFKNDYAFIPDGILFRVVRKEKHNPPAS